MAITADLGGKNYVLPKGKAFFDRYANGITILSTTQGEGERYLGNTPGCTLSAAAENLDHFSAEGGLKVKDDSVQLSLNRSGKLSCDNITGENLALTLIGSSATVAQTAQVGLVTVFTAAKRGHFYQLGVSESNPSGLRNVKNVVVKSGAPGFATTVAMAGNYQLDAELGRLYVEADSAGINNIDIQVTFDTDASSREQVVSGTSAIYGALRIVADNPKGTNRDVYMPYVKLTPDGDFALKSDSWMQMDFTLEVLKKADNIAAIYLDGRPTVG